MASDASALDQVADDLRQIEEIKQTIPQLQGTVDVNFKEQTLSFDKVDTKLQDFDNTLKSRHCQQICAVGPPPQLRSRSHV